MSRKILYSPGYGSGWSSWSNIPTKIICEYQPFIDAIENGIKIDEDSELFTEFMAYLTDLGFEYLCAGGLGTLSVFEVPDGDSYRINEYDGDESIELLSESEWN